MVFFLDKILGVDEDDRSVRLRKLQFEGTKFLEKKPILFWSIQAPSRVRVILLTCFWREFNSLQCHFQYIYRMTDLTIVKTLK